MEGSRGNGAGGELWMSSPCASRACCHKPPHLLGVLELKGPRHLMHRFPLTDSQCQQGGQGNSKGWSLGVLQTCWVTQAPQYMSQPFSVALTLAAVTSFTLQGSDSGGFH